MSEKYVNAYSEKQMKKKMPPFPFYGLL